MSHGTRKREGVGVKKKKKKKKTDRQTQTHISFCQQLELRCPVPASRSRPPCGVAPRCSCEPAGRPSSGLALSGCAQTALTGWRWWTALCWQPTADRGGDKEKNETFWFPDTYSARQSLGGTLWMYRLSDNLCVCVHASHFIHERA